MNRYSKIKDFHGSRLTGIGSSDIPTLAGLAKKYGQTPYTLWRLKSGLDFPKSAGPRAEWGHRLEGLVLAKWVEDHYGEEPASDFLQYKNRGRSLNIFKTETEARLSDRPYVIAHADLLVDAEEPVIVEAKTAGFFSAQRDDDDPDSGYSKTDFSHNGIPASVFLQVQWQMLAYGVNWAFVAALIDTGDYREYGPIKADPRIQEKCLALAERFWQCVESGQPPKPETWADVSTMWPQPQDLTAMLGGEEEMRARAMVEEYHKIKARMKDDDARASEIVNALGIYMGENKTLNTAEGVKLASSWFVESPTISSRSQMDAEAVKVIESHPILGAEVASLDIKREEVKKQEKVVFGMIEAEADVYAALTGYGAVKKGWRVLRPSKIKGGAE